VGVTPCCCCGNPDCPNAVNGHVKVFALCDRCYGNAAIAHSNRWSLDCGYVNWRVSNTAPWWLKAAWWLQYVLEPPSSLYPYDKPR
jgi:hypothetical protein